MRNDGHLRESAGAVDPFGRDAADPASIPWPGWREIVVRVWREFSNDRVLLVGAGATFYLLLALVPALSASVSIYGLFTDPSAVAEQLRLVEDWIPAEGRQILAEQLGRLAGQQTSELGFALVLSLAVALWSSNAGMKAMFEAMNVAYGEVESRSFVRLTLVSLAFTVAAILLLLTLLTVLVGLPVVIAWLGLLDTFGGLALRGASGLALACAALVLLAALYRWGPSRQQARWRWITPGALVAVVLGGMASAGFSFYLSRFGNYNETYGSLGAMIAFMTWLWILTVLVITGAELNAELEHQTARDSTTGDEAPLGSRGARMADTVARGPADVKTGPTAARAQDPGAEARADPDTDTYGRRWDLVSTSRRGRVAEQGGGAPGALVSAIAIALLVRDLIRRSKG